MRKSYAIPFLNKTTPTTGASNVTVQSDFRENQSFQITGWETEAEGTELLSPKDQKGSNTNNFFNRPPGAHLYALKTLSS